MSHRVRAKLFVEKFLQEEGAEADTVFKCDLENAIEELLDEVAEDAVEAASNKQKPLVWQKVVSSSEASSHPLGAPPVARVGDVVELITSVAEPS